MRGIKQKTITALMIAALACSQGTAVFAEEGNLSTVEDAEIATEETVENDAENVEQNDAEEDTEQPVSEKDGTAESVSVSEESVDTTKNEPVVLAEESVSVGDEIISEGMTYVVTKAASGTTHGTVKLTNG